MTSEGRCCWILEAAERGSDGPDYCMDPTGYRKGKRLPFCPQHQEWSDADEAELEDRPGDDGWLKFGEGPSVPVSGKPGFVIH